MLSCGNAYNFAARLLPTVQFKLSDIGEGIAEVQVFISFIYLRGCYYSDFMCCWC